MKIGCGWLGPPIYRHLPTTTIGIILTLQNFRTKTISQTLVTKASESESFIVELISGFMMEFHHF